MSRSVTLVLLSYNEYESLKSLFPQIPIDLFEHVIAVDGGSSDGTLALYAEKGIPCYVQSQRGRGRAYHVALQHVTTDGVVFFSTDGNEDPLDLEKIRYYLEAGHDMVVAGRYIRKGAETDNSDDWLRIRKGTGILGSFVVRMLWQVAVWDAINGFRGFRTEALQAMYLDAPLHDIELQSTIRAGKLNMQVKEFPTKERRRIAGEHRTSANTGTLLFQLAYMLIREMVIGKRFTS